MRERHLHGGIEKKRTEEKKSRHERVMGCVACEDGARGLERGYLLGRIMSICIS